MIGTEAQHRPVSWWSRCLAAWAAKGRPGHGTATAGAAGRSLAPAAAEGPGACATV